MSRCPTVDEGKVAMSNYYRVMFRDDEDAPLVETIGASDIFSLPDTGKVADWNTLVLEFADGEYSDYLASDLGCRLCSERLKVVLDSHTGPSDEIQWLKVLVRHGTEERPYYVLHFPNPPDVLDKKKTIFAGGDFVVKPVLSKESARGHRVFAYPNCGCLPLFVCEDVKNEIKKEKLTGMVFSKLPVVTNS